jgi:hypothetical protein
MWLRLMWLITGWACKGAYDSFTANVKALKTAKAKEYAEAFQSGMASSDALAVSGLADAFEAQEQGAYARKLRGHVTDLQAQASRVVITPPSAPTPQAPSDGDAPEEAA